MRVVSDKFLELDNTEWFSEVFDDRRNIKIGEKKIGSIVSRRTLIKVNMSRIEIRTMALFRFGALPISIGTGR